MKDIIVYKRSLAQKLVKQGYKIIDVQPNRKDENRTVFFFENEDGLEERIKDLAHGQW